MPRGVAVAAAVAAAAAAAAVAAAAVAVAAVAVAAAVAAAPAPPRLGQGPSALLNVYPVFKRSRNLDLGVLRFLQCKGQVLGFLAK